MFVTLLALLVNAAPIAESVHKRDVVGSHQWIARLAQSAATVPDQAAEKKLVDPDSVADTLKCIDELHGNYENESTSSAPDGGGAEV
ncbi:hypothetical protein AX14_008385 [Amanita brunnescens Koide BX004]|nr:hypothetical protein AX14_008385 [Amanita brunnescens Koide BX004]